MFTSTEGIEWPRVLFVGWIVLAGLGLLAAWIRGRLRGNVSESPAEVPVIMSDTETIDYPGCKIALKSHAVEFSIPAHRVDGSWDFNQSDHDQTSIFIEKSVCEELLNDPQYSDLQFNTFHQSDD